MSAPELKHLDLVQRIVNSNFSFYQRDHCFSLYFKRGQSRMCNCSIPTEWEVDGLESCRSSKYAQCLKEAYNKIIKEEFKAKVLRECPAECDSVSYSKVVTSGEYGTPAEIQSVLNRSGYLRERARERREDEVRNAVLYLRVFFEELRYTRVTEIPKISVADFVASIGGTIGLFLGMSFISSFELFILLFEMACCFLADRFRKLRAIALRT